MLSSMVLAGPVSAAQSWWRVQTVAAPTNLPPGGTGTVVLIVENAGDAPVNGASAPVTIADKLPPGLVATSIFGLAGTAGIRGEPTCELATVSCTWSSAEELQPYESIEVKIAVSVSASAASEENEALVSGGEAPSVSARRQLTVDGARTPFGVESFGFAAEEGDGSSDLQAGSHPFQLTTAFALNGTGVAHKGPALPRNLRFDLPTGLAGNPTVTPRCTEAQFTTILSGVLNLCPSDTVVGVASVTSEPISFTSFPAPLTYQVPVFNLAPDPGEPARFGFELVRVPVILDASLRTGGDYGISVSTNNTTEGVTLLSARVTLWGVPGDPRHDNARGWSCVAGGFWLAESGVPLPPCAPLGVSAPRPLLTMPTSCAGPFESIMRATSWPTRANPEGIALPPVIPGEPAVSMGGCERLPFNPQLSVVPDSGQAATPTGLDVDLHLPALENAGGLAESVMKKATVTLPAGVVVNPSAANGLGACTQAQIGLDNANPASCPDSAKVGTAEALTPVLPNPLTGSVYVAQQGANPFGGLLALYLVLEGEGVLVKLAGEVRLDPVTGQITTTFDDIPQQPVSDIKLHLFGGSRATLVSPPGCGTYTATSQLAPYSGQPAAEPSSAFGVTSGPGGAPCGPQQFAPSFAAGTSTNQAGGFSPFSVTFSRQDSEQALGAIKLTTPAGLLGLLKTVPLCGEPQASAGTCGQASLIGHTTVLAGAGSEPVSVAGQVFLTGPYKGAPFGLSVVVPAVAGPFNLGNVVVRAAIGVDPHTAQITVTSDPLPSILQGIPLQMKTVNVTIDRQGFMFNPTNCEALAVDGTLSSAQGASANVSSRFQAANCAALSFKPLFSVSTQAATSKKNGASLDVKVSYPQGAEANIRSVAVTLPKQLPARLTTIQQACPQATFAANPASCPAGSNIGAAMATTPVLASPLTGPAYLVSHGGAAFPDLVVVLQGEGITLDLVGSIDIKHGVTSSTFASVPDAPISSFELKLPEGPHSGLAAVVPAKAKGNMCGQALRMPTTLTGQNGAVLKQTTKITVSGCSKAKKKAKTKKHRKAKKKRK